MGSGHSVAITWRGRRVVAFVPDPLAGRRFELPERVVRATERAAASVIQADDRIAHRFETLARLLLRTEGVASSQIEGVRAPASRVAVAELDPSDVDTSSAWVADNLAVVDASLQHARSRKALRARDLHEWHRRLMVHGALPDEMVGRFRPTQNWVGGPTPREAAYVPPPPDLVRPLMKDLLGFLNSTRCDPITSAALAHAQFETIHPYGDGNGRLGRVLIGWSLARRLGVATPPPVSVVMARDIGGYLSGLTRFRQGEVAAWVQWFADGVRQSAEQVASVAERAERVQRRWDDLLSDVRADATARRLVDVVQRHLVVTAPMAADALGVSTPTSRNAIEALAARGILQRLDIHTAARGRPPQWWVAGELVSLVTAWSR